ncbi:type III secretion system export apparatus subunit SctR [Pseudaestuariivita rosea]|uniref:type III secretion system export apparatus subunit SctR n=1 Tax=Pseudaestuariivita rosea TaxID=2763263 RepID=UPI001ABAE54A|nr:type III secretion system export apparatus subunit SctR [Pseudaestuariivita rosea]
MIEDSSPTILAILSVTIGLGLVTFLVVTTTSFIKVSVVLFIVRNAIGIQQTPPNIVLYAIALTLTAFISAPVVQGVIDQVLALDSNFDTLDDWIAAFEQAQGPIKAFLMDFTNEAERAFFLDATTQVWPEDRASQAQTTDLAVLMPSFLITELKRAFEIGFLLYLPFVVIDLIVTTILMAMGMSMVTPTIISTPCKLFLFVAVDGWSLLLHGLLLTYTPGL